MSKQFIMVAMAKRDQGATQWQVQRTPYQGNVRDAHNSISIMVDGQGFLHMAWDHHGHPLRDCRSEAPGAWGLTKKLPTDT